MTREKFFKTEFISAFDESKGHKRKKTKDEEQIDKYVDPITKKIDHNLLKKMNQTKSHYVFSGSSFRSDQDIAESILKNLNEQKDPEPVNHIDPSLVNPIEKEVCANQKAAILARKYKNDHFLLRKFSKQNCMNWSKKKIDFIFNLAKQIKAERSYYKDDD